MIPLKEEMIVFKRTIAYLATLALGGSAVWFWPQRSATMEKFQFWWEGLGQERLWKLLILAGVAFLLFVFYDWFTDNVLKRTWIVVLIIVVVIVFSDDIKVFFISLGPVFTGFPLIPFLVIVAMLVVLCWTFSVLRSNATTLTAGERLQKTKGQFARIGRRLQAMRLKRSDKKEAS